MTIHFLLPFFRPQKCGVSDHSSVLAKHINQLFGESSRLLTVYDHEPAPHDTFIDCRSLDSLNNPLALSQALDQGGLGEDDALLVQLSLYGYQKRAVPLTLVKALRRLRVDKPRLKIGVFFHELWAVSERPWTSSYWLSGIQQTICQQIAKLADVNFSNRLSSVEWLQRHESRLTYFSPTFSNIGEPAEIPDWSRREEVIAVFGSAGARAAVYRDLARLHDVVHLLGCKRLIDIGPPGPHTKVLKLLEVPVQIEGLLPDEAVRECLMASRYGVFETVWSAATKSGVFAAYLANGVVPFSIRPGPDNLYGCMPQPEHGKHFLSIHDRLSLIDEQEYEAISAAGVCWYRQHDADAAARTVFEGLRSAERMPQAADVSAMDGVQRRHGLFEMRP